MLNQAKSRSDGRSTIRERFDLQFWWERLHEEACGVFQKSKKREVELLELDRAEWCSQHWNQPCISTIEFSRTATFRLAHPADRSGRLQAQILEGGLEPLLRFGNGTFLFRHIAAKKWFRSVIQLYRHRHRDSLRRKMKRAGFVPVGHFPLLGKSAKFFANGKIHLRRTMLHKGFLHKELHHFLACLNFHNAIKKGSKLPKAEHFRPNCVL